MPSELTERQRRNFFAKVDVTDGCWLWTGAVDTGGYGCLCLNKRTLTAHRVSWELHNGPIAGGLHVLHSCDVRTCVNPHHLTLGSNADNMADRNAKGRQAHLRGQENGHSRLTEAQVLEIRRSCNSYSELAHIYGVNITTIGRVVRRETWFHI